MNIIKEVNETTMTESICRYAIFDSTSRFCKVFHRPITELYSCQYCFIYTKTKVLFLKARYNLMKIQFLYDINDLPEEYIDMIIYDKLQKL